MRSPQPLKQGRQAASTAHPEGPGLSWGEAVSWGGCPGHGHLRKGPGWEARCLGEAGWPRGGARPGAEACAHRHKKPLCSLEGPGASSRLDVPHAGPQILGTMSGLGGELGAQLGGRAALCSRTDLATHEVGTRALRLLTGERSGQAPIGKHEQCGCCPEWPGRDPWAGAWGTALQHCSWGWGAGGAPAAPRMAAPTPRARRTRSESQEQGREGSSGCRTQRPESSHWLLSTGWISLSLTSGPPPLGRSKVALSFLAHSDGQQGPRRGPTRPWKHTGHHPFHCKEPCLELCPGSSHCQAGGHLP